MNRRMLLGATALVPTLALIRCAGQSASRIAADVNLIASGLTAVVAQIGQIPGVPSAALTQVDFYLAKIEADAVKIARATSTPATSTVQEVSQVVQALASVVLLLVPAGSVIEATIQAAVSLLPVILAAVGVAGAGVPAKYPPARARAILAAFH